VKAIYRQPLERGNTRAFSWLPRQIFDLTFLFQRFAFEGIGQLLEHLLVSEAKRIRLANANGIRKMIRNILALQQSIKTLTSDTRGADFDRAKKYYTLFFRTPTVRALCRICPVAFVR